ncbi:hypothetical protein M422DRAFT_35273, partial [Sphaerobolus stellatus SS14]
MKYPSCESCSIVKPDIILSDDTSIQMLYKLCIFCINSHRKRTRRGPREKFAI